MLADLIGRHHATRLGVANTFVDCGECFLVFFVLGMYWVLKIEPFHLSHTFTIHATRENRDILDP